MRKHYPNLIGIGRGMIEESISVPGWWKKKPYSYYIDYFTHETLLRSLKEDIRKGEVPPPEVLEHFPELQ